MGAVTKTLSFFGGVLIDSPTNATAPDFGGTRLGAVQGVELSLTRVTYANRAEEYAGEVAKHIHLRWDVSLTAIGMSWDQDLLAADLGAEVSTNPDGIPTITIPARNPGESFEGRRLLFAPYRQEHAGFLLLEAVGLGPGGPFVFSNYQSNLHRARFQARRSALNEVLVSDRVSRLPL